jgi:hypothetical protein
MPQPGITGESLKMLFDPSSRRVSSVARAAQLARVRNVTTAYLDMNQKNDRVASEWLIRDARRWLGDAADLKCFGMRLLKHMHTLW